MRYALILACDLLDDGSDIGPKTILRLEAGLDHWRKTGEQLVVAASMSPNHPGQTDTMAELMSRWLQTHGCNDVTVLRAKMFNTRGETDAFFSLIDANTVISAPWHLRRVKIQLISDYGFAFMKQVNYVSVESHTMSSKEKFLLEPLKLTFEVITFKWRRSARNWLSDRVVSILRLVGIRLSY